MVRAVKITWYGHSTFLLEDERGKRLLTDPCDTETGYVQEGIECDAVTISHKHHDHCNMDAFCGDPVIVDDVGEHMVQGIKITGFPSFHDDVQGEKRGPNIMYAIDMDDMRILHCGDLGYVPDESELAAMGVIDILLVPIGGIFTLDQTQARELANKLHAKVVIPMHYKTAALTFELGELLPFINNAVGCKIHRLNEPDATINRNSLGEDRIVVLDYVR